jgi:hypothetical protein
MTRLSFLNATAALALLAGCAVPPPSSPTVMALPNAGKPLPVFRTEDDTCRQYASQEIAASAALASKSSQANGAASVAIGTGISVAAGAIFGAVIGQAGPGAVVGAGLGLLGGSADAATIAHQKGNGLQQMYNVAYAQCMTSKGNGIVQPAYAVR